MGIKFDGYRRLTFQFNDGWKDEDEHEFLGEFMILKSRIRQSSNHDTSNGEAGERIYTVRAPRCVSEADIINALRDAFTSGCRCEHDCCGHLQTYAYLPKRQKRRTWVVEVRCYYNV
jgi:hypothetical protein